MEYGPYEIIRVSNLRYKFYSEGPKGRVEKQVIFEKLWRRPKGYCIALGDVTRDGNIDDVIVTDNKDSERVFLTVVWTMIRFLKVRNDSWVWIKGSSEARNRLYRMTISRLKSDFGSTFEISGCDGNDWGPFERDVEYFEYIIRLKN